jgi:hypothetical protein
MRKRTTLFALAVLALSLLAPSCAVQKGPAAA